jgi:hypothetical protein
MLEYAHDRRVKAQVSLSSQSESKQLSNDLDGKLQDLLKKRPTEAAQLTLISRIFDMWSSGGSTVLRPGWDSKLEDWLKQDFVLKNGKLDLDFQESVFIKYTIAPTLSDQSIGSAATLLGRRISGIYHMMSEKFNDRGCFANGSGYYLYSDSLHWYLTATKPTSGGTKTVISTSPGGRWGTVEGEVRYFVCSAQFRI